MVPLTDAGLSPRKAGLRACLHPAALRVDGLIILESERSKEVGLDEKRLLTRKAQYQALLKNLPPRGRISITFGGDRRRALEALISGDQGRGEHYVYLHRGARDEVFYVGKGQGRRAFSKDRDQMWHHYVLSRCTGEYAVEIVKYFESDDEALDFEGDLISLFGDYIVNTINPARKINYDVNARFHELRRANWARIASALALLEANVEDAESVLRAAISHMTDYARLSWEDGLYAELKREVYPDSGCHLNSQDLSALNKLSLLLKAQARWRELIAMTDSFFETYPETRQQSTAKQVIKRCEIARGSLNNDYSAATSLIPGADSLADGTVEDGG